MRTCFSGYHDLSEIIRPSSFIIRHRQLDVEKYLDPGYFLLETGRKLNKLKTVRGHPGHLPEVLRTFNLFPVSSRFVEEIFYNSLRKNIKHKRVYFQYFSVNGNSMTLGFSNIEIPIFVSPPLGYRTETEHA